MKFIKALILILTACILSIWTQPTQAQETTDTYSVANKSFYDIFYDTLEEQGVDPNQVAIALYDFETDTHYYVNEHYIMLGASTTKVGTAALFTQLINQGILSYDTLIPYVDSMYEAGGGEITNNPAQDAYPISDLIYQMLYNSDNTAWNLLTNYYYTYFGNYQEDLLLFSEAPIDDETLYQFNHINALVLEGILIQVASDPTYQDVIDIMLTAQEDWLLKSQDGENMATKYGQLDSYFHDIGIKYNEDEEEPHYAIVVMTDGAYYQDENEFFGTLNERYHRWLHSDTKIASN